MDEILENINSDQSELADEDEKKSKRTLMNNVWLKLNDPNKDQIYYQQSTQI
jgi:hypothetical protein